MPTESKSCPCCESFSVEDSSCLFPSMIFIEGFGYQCIVCGYLEETNDE